jgi:tetratricopeptide (TPR) repeat protein
MDLTTLSLFVMLAISAIGADTVWHHGDVILESKAAGKLNKATIDVGMMDLILKHEVARVSAMPSIIGKPRIRTSSRDGVGMAIAAATNMQGVAYALQSQFGLQPNDINVTLFSEDDTAKVLVTGIGNLSRITFEQSLVQDKGETVVDLIRRAALVGLAHIDPYITALYLIRAHQVDRNFNDVQAEIEFAKSQLPPTPINFDRSLLENLQGIMALFGNDPSIAHEWFRRAVASSPDNIVAELNRNFSDLQISHYQEVSDRLQDVVAHRPPSDPILLGTAYMTWAASRLGLNDADGADRLMAKAIEVNPRSAIAYNFWADVKQEKGDVTGAAEMRQKALDVSGMFENYAEVAALYFQLSWLDHQPLTRSKFDNPPAASLD